jgi:hypothetical protein
LPPRVSHVDASASIGGHGPNSALLSLDVQQLVRTATGLPPLSLPMDTGDVSSGSWSLADDPSDEDENSTVSLEADDDSDIGGTD